jgi:hypothetical protein
MLRISLLTIATAALWAQSAGQKGPEPPPEVEKAVRARTTEFCELHKQGKFRQAELMVADETKDYFYDSAKPRYVSYQIQSIAFNEDFTQARAMVICEQYLPALGFQGQTVKMLTPFNWKLVNGEWMWYLSKDALLFTPFGSMTEKPRTELAGKPLDPPAPQVPVVIPTSIEQFLGMIKADKNTLELKPGASGQVTITNGMPGLITLEIVQQIPGMEAKLENANVPAGGKGVLTVHAGEKPAFGAIQLRVKPIGPPLSIKVTID